MKNSLLVRLLRNRSGMVGMILIVIYLTAAVLGVFSLLPYSPIEQHVKDRMQPPSSQYLMGTDEFGRDIFSRVLRGATNSLKVALFSVAAAGLAGILLGASAGYVGGRFDNIVMRTMDIFFAFPAILLALAIVAALGANAGNTILAIAIVYTPIFARVARGPTLSVKATEYVTAARSIGARNVRILGRHVLPNITAPLIVQLSLALSWAILTEAGLSFLGLGAQPPQPSWGNMLSESRSLMELAPWMTVFPGLAIMLCVLGFNLLGDGLRDVLDPRLRSL
ncbi:MAG: ABC transporter permease [Caldilineaceae bacterium]|nr:ABC transporter permease [Caldilineaceae bacterium]MBP8107424.1 ABC transporter permease [Caldilineaceae bacterium]MBP8123359.1 ABC transporter permease [Caldilineaceae bacterium]MBP9070967.1 ABC transporter permease [Caldilineaceae bacterium]